MKKLHIVAVLALLVLVNALTGTWAYIASRNKIIGYARREFGSKTTLTPEDIERLQIEYGVTLRGYEYHGFKRASNQGNNDNDGSSVTQAAVTANPGTLLPARHMLGSVFFDAIMPVAGLTGNHFLTFTACTWAGLQSGNKAVEGTLPYAFDRPAGLSPDSPNLVANGDDVYLVITDSNGGVTSESPVGGFSYKELMLSFIGGLNQDFIRYIEPEQTPLSFVGRTPSGASYNYTIRMRGRDGQYRPVNTLSLSNEHQAILARTPMITSYDDENTALTPIFNDINGIVPTPQPAPRTPRQGLGEKPKETPQPVDTDEYISLS